MSIRINFLPPSFQPPRKMGWKDVAIAVAAAMVLSGGGFYYTDLYFDLTSTKALVQATEKKTTDVKDQVSQFEEIVRREARVAEVERGVQAIKGRHWSPILLGFRDLTPQQMYWTEFQVEQNVATLSGSAASLMDVAQFVVGLMVSPAVTQVDLQVVTEEGDTLYTTVMKGEAVIPALTGPQYCWCRLTFTLTVHLIPVGEQEAI